MERERHRHWLAPFLCSIELKRNFLSDYCCILCNSITLRPNRPLNHPWSLLSRTRPAIITPSPLAPTPSWWTNPLSTLQEREGAAPLWWNLAKILLKYSYSPRLESLRSWRFRIGADGVAARLTHKVMMMRMMNMRMAVMSILGYSHLTCKTRPSSRGSLGNWECITLEREYSGEKGGLQFCAASYVGIRTATIVTKKARKGRSILLPAR